MGGLVGVIVHGMHVEALEWEMNMWGVPPRHMGRIPAGILAAIRMSASCVVFGTGASERKGRKEAEVIVEYMFANFPRLSEFSAFSEFSQENLAHIEYVMGQKLHTETTSRNTVEEIRAAFRIFVAKHITRAVHVSSQTHISRCIRDGCAVSRESEFDGKIKIGRAHV